jgi:molybdopterin converting factor small subunit
VDIISVVWWGSVNFEWSEQVVKIIVKSPFNLSGIEVETQSATLGTLLAELSRNDTLTNIRFFDPGGGEVYPDCDVQLNGQSYGALDDGLDTGLKDGDQVEIIMFTLAGG